jgi:hypothetical protein
MYRSHRPPNAAKQASKNANRIQLLYNYPVKMDKYTVTCPCCEATLTVDAGTGALLAHQEKKKVLGSFEDLKGELSKQKELREQIFAQEMSSMKDRERLLEEKFKEAMKRADTDAGKPFKNPLDLD